MVHVKQIYEIAKLKQQDADDIAVVPLQNVFKTIKNQCKSMGIEVDYRSEKDFAAAQEQQQKTAAAAAEAAAALDAKKKKKK